MKLFQVTNEFQPAIVNRVGAVHALRAVEPDGHYRSACGRRYAASSFRVVTVSEGDEPGCQHCKNVVSGAREPHRDLHDALREATQQAAAKLLAEKQIEISRLRLRVAALECELEQFGVERDVAA